MNDDYIKEKQLSNLPKSVPIDALKFLIPKTETSICKIELNEGGHGTGFFCNITKGWNTIKVIMTNHHVLNEEDISIGKKIVFSLNNDKIFYDINIDKSRKTYTNKQYDITIIEIKQNDNLDKIDFFDIDKRIFNENPNEIFKNEQIYLLHYPKGNRMEYSMGLIKDIKDDNFTIRHLCDSACGSSGAPIINTINFQVIGIHKGAPIGNNNWNLGTLLKEPIENFNNDENENYIKESDNIEIKKENIEKVQNDNITIEKVKEKNKKEYITENYKFKKEKENIEKVQNNNIKNAKENRQKDKNDNIKIEKEKKIIKKNI